MTDCPIQINMALLILHVTLYINLLYLRHLRPDVPAHKVEQAATREDYLAEAGDSQHLHGVREFGILRCGGKEVITAHVFDAVPLRNGAGLRI